MKNIGFKKVKKRKWLHKIMCFLFGHWMAECPDGSGDLFCERGYGG